MKYEAPSVSLVELSGELLVLATCSQNNAQNNASSYDCGNNACSTD